MKGRENFKVTFKAGSHRVLSGIIAARRRANLKSWLKQILEVRGKNRPQEPRQVQTLTGQGKGLKAKAKTLKVRTKSQGQVKVSQGQVKVSQGQAKTSSDTKREAKTSRVKARPLSFKAWPKDRSSPELHSWQRPHKVKKQFDIYVHTDKRVSNEL